MKGYLLVLVGVVLGGFASSWHALAKDGKSELEGTWELVAFERDGQEVKLEKTTRSINAGNRFTVMVGGKVIAAGTAKLDPTKKPKTVDVTYTEGPDKGKTFKGIYEFDGDTARFCRPGSPDDERPRQFATKAGSGAFVAAYRRVKR
jgi:uncharacterized protein (TIGR03067 family)